MSSKATLDDSPSLKENALEAWLDSQDFYELCQTYRHAEQGGRVGRGLSASQAYENLKEGIRLAAIREGGAPIAKEGA